jgi:MFS transporter, VNT family, synaptic vesicle glycoprotein 2
MSDQSSDAPQHVHGNVNNGGDHLLDQQLPRSLDDYFEAAAAASAVRIQPTLASASSSPTATTTTDDRVSFTPTTTTGDDYCDSTDTVFQQYYYPWRYWLIYISLGMANSSDASEVLCLSYLLSMDRFEETILHHTAWRAGRLAATVFMGMLMGGLVVGGAGDSFGRQPLLVAGLAIHSIAGFASAAATNVFFLSGCRFIAGLGIGATVPPLFALCSELAPPSSRGFWVTSVASFWMVGSLYVAIVGWMIQGQAMNDNNNTDVESVSWWRLFVVACALPSCIGCVLVRSFVPESPRFLLLQGRHDEALSVAHGLANSMRYTGPLLTRDELLFHYPIEDIPRRGATNSRRLMGNGNVNHEGPNGDVDDDAVVSAYPRDSAMIRPLLMEENDGASMMESNTQQYQRRSSRMLHRTSWTASTFQNAVRTALRDCMVSTSKLYAPDMRSTTWPLQLVWFSLSFGSYGLMTWINTLFVQVHLENVYFNALLFSASNLPGNILSAVLMEKTGRASLLTGSILAASLSLVAFAYVAAHQSSDEDNDTASWIVLAACSFQCFTIASWNAIDVLTSELFPTSVRSTGMGVCAATGRIGAMLAQFVNGALVSHPVRLLLTAAGALFLGALTPAFLPADQTGRPIQDYTTDSIDANHIRLSPEL